MMIRRAEALLEGLLSGFASSSPYAEGCTSVCHLSAVAQQPL